MKMKNSLKALLKEFSNNSMIEDYKTVKKIFLCVMRCLEWLFKYAPIATLGNIFWIFHVVCKL